VHRHLAKNQTMTNMVELALSKFGAAHNDFGPFFFVCFAMFVACCG
jgi:hypothetical protein